MDWLFVPIDAARGHDVGAWISWHGRAMALAWGVLVPLGVVLARYYKVTPRQNWPEELDNRFWWRAHLGFQWSAASIFAGGLLLILMNDQPGAAAWWHRFAGWALAAGAVVQVMFGVFRGSKGGPGEPTLRGDHFDMTPWRYAFEFVHKRLGYILLTVGAFGILTGMWAANAPVWMWLSLGIWWTGLALAAVRLERLGRVVDTYQAIWGDDPNLPGNRKAGRRHADRAQTEESAE